MVVHRFLSRSAEEHPDVVALIEPPSSVTYGDLDAMANRIAHVLCAGGVRRGDRVVIALKNGVEFVACYFGVLKAGAVVVPLAAGPRSDRFRKVVEECAPSACVIDRAAAACFARERTLDRIPLLLVGGTPSVTDDNVTHELELKAAIEGAPPTPLADTATDLDLAAIIYTSGSTGEPRGVMLTHHNIVTNTRSIIAYLNLGRQDRGMCVLPFYHVYGLSQLLTHMAVGGSLVIENNSVFPNVVLQEMREHRVTGFAGVPSTFALLLHGSALREFTFPDLRYVTQAGGHMPPAWVLEWLEQGPQAPFYVMYGATEASARLTYLEPRDLRRKLGSIGKAIPNVEMRVITDSGEEAAPGECGELVASGENISSGYWKDPEASLARFGPLGYRTGDLAYRDDEGFLFLVGRRHDMIKVGAHRIGSSEVENVLHQHPDVLEAAVVGVPHDILGEAPVALVSVRPGATLGRKTLLAFCRTSLASHKVPVDIIFKSELPRSGIGKIDKVSLRESARIQQMDRIEERIREFVVTSFLFGDDDGSLKADDSFLENGVIDSTGFLELVAHLEQTYRIEVRDNEFVPANFDSIHRIVTYVKRKLQK
jgi:long-chain acyl-CoA synthetase